MNPGDREEIRGATFTPHDPIYLAECLYLRDAARSPTLPDLKPEQLADLGFAWVCREVHLRPWLTPTATPGSLSAAALAPTYVLRRGYGSGLERMYVFLGLLQQMGLDGCLLGPPDVKSVLSYLMPNSTDPTSCWAARAVHSGPSAFASGPTSGSTIRGARSIPSDIEPDEGEPEKYQAWFASRRDAFWNHRGQFEDAVLYFAVPVNSLRRRMVMLEEKLKPEVGANSRSTGRAQGRVPDPKPIYWNPPNDDFAYGRTARMFLPVDEGGADRSERSQNQRFQAYIMSQLPIEKDITALAVNSPAALRESKETLEIIKKDIKDRFAVFSRGSYGLAFLEAPTPRERVQRGHFQDAAKILVERQEDFSRALLRVKNTPDRDNLMREWMEKAFEIYLSFGPQNPNARADSDKHWASAGASLIIDRAVGESGQAEAAYLLALCKHEQAERHQARLEHTTGSEVSALKPGVIDAWKVALSEWYSYRDQYSAGRIGLPGLAEHAKELTARAEKLSRQR